MRQRVEPSFLLPFALVPLPSKVAVTCLPTSMRRPWFPPVVHVNTRRLCSAGSGCLPVPRRHSSYAALRLPCSRRPRLRSSLAFGLPRRGPLFCAMIGPAARAPADALRVGVLSPDLRGSGLLARRRRASQVPGSSSSCVPWSKTPPGADLASPTSGSPPWPSGGPMPWAPGKVLVSWLHGPRPTRSRAYASTHPSPGTLQGSLPVRAGSPLTGRASHPLDDVRGFLNSSHRSFLPGQ
jgi:hypothetical protein